MIGRAWKVYGDFGHRQKASFGKTFEVWPVNRNYVKIFNSDITGTNDYSILYIIGKNATECEDELNGQLSDGVFENCRTGRMKEIPALYIHDLTGDIWTLEEVIEAFKDGKKENLYDTFDEFEEKDQIFNEKIDLIDLFGEDANRWEKIMEISHQIIDGCDAQIIHLFESSDLSINQGRSGKEYIWYTSEFENSAIEIETGKVLTEEEIEEDLA